MQKDIKSQFLFVLMPSIVKICAKPWDKNTSMRSKLLLSNFCQISPRFNFWAELWIFEISQKSRKWPFLAIFASIRSRRLNYWKRSKLICKLRYDCTYKACNMSFFQYKNSNFWTFSDVNMTEKWNYRQLALSDTQAISCSLFSTINHIE